MKYIWRYRRINATRYELVLKEEGCLYEERVVRAPGYQSTKLRDILEAAWYLNSGFKGHLTDRQMYLLDLINEDALQNFRSNSGAATLQ